LEIHNRGEKNSTNKYPLLLIYKNHNGTFFALMFSIVIFPFTGFSPLFSFLSIEFYLNPLMLFCYSLVDYKKKSAQIRVFKLNLKTKIRKEKKENRGKISRKV